MASKGFVPTHVLVSEEGERFELVKKEGGSYVDFVTYYMGGRAIFPSELTAVGTTALVLTEEERANYVKTSNAYDEVLAEVRSLTEELEAKKSKLALLKEKMNSATEAVS